MPARASTFRQECARRAPNSRVAGARVLAPATRRDTLRADRRYLGDRADNWSSRAALGLERALGVLALGRSLRADSEASVRERRMRDDWARAGVDHPERERWR